MKIAWFPSKVKGANLNQEDNLQKTEAIYQERRNKNNHKLSQI